MLSSTTLELGNAIPKSGWMADTISAERMALRPASMAAT